MPLVAPGQNPMMAQRSSDLGPLLGAWGLDLADGKVVGDNKLIYNNILPFLSLTDGYFSEEDVTTLNLNMISMLFAVFLYWSYFAVRARMMVDSW